MDKQTEWAVSAEKFAEDGNPYAMRGAASEILDLNRDSAEGLAIKAEAALYLNELYEAEPYAIEALEKDSENLRAKLVMGGIMGTKLRIIDEIKLLEEVIKEARRIIDEMDRAEHNKYNRARHFLATKTLAKALRWIADALYLAGDATGASNALLESGKLTDNKNMAMEFYSKHLFLRNYRENPPSETKALAKEFNKFLTHLRPHAYGLNVIDSPNKKLKIGYISPDFRYHAAANFFMPLVKNFDTQNFTVTCYYTGKIDKVTKAFQHYRVYWRDLIGYNTEASAQMIYDENIDILVDLSGHTQNSALPIMAYKPAPIQMSMIGYTATTGLDTIDYFISDVNSSPENPEGFTEKVLRLPNCHLCYSPIIKVPNVGKFVPVTNNNFVTFGCFNNFAKINDNVLSLWREILDAVPKSVLVIKNKLCNIKQGETIILERLRQMNFPMDRIRLRKFTADYLKGYHDIDIALDPFPYNGGLTTCEALYMGVPVIALRGSYHGSNFGTTILNAAGVPELIANTPEEYVKKAIILASNPNLMAKYHVTLRDKVTNSRLMDAGGYMRDLEAVYRSVWQKFLNKIK